MSETPTPRTDKHWEKIKGSGFWENNPTRLEMEQLERELAETQEKLAAELRSWNELTGKLADMRVRILEVEKQRDALAADCERFRYAIDQTAFYFSGTSNKHITEILTRVLEGESVQEIRASHSKEALAAVKGDKL